MCECVLAQGYHYVFVCLPDSHVALYDWLKYLDANGEVQELTIRQRHGRHWHFYHYRWVNGIPLRDTQPAITTNWFDLTVRILDFRFWILD